MRLALNEQHKRPTYGRRWAFFMHLLRLQACGLKTTCLFLVMLINQ